MRTKEGVYQAESLYEFARDQLDDEEKTFFDNCFRLLQIGREATKLGNEIKEIGKQIRKYLKDNQFQPWQIKRRENDDFLQELTDRRKEMYKQIRELNDLFSQQSSIVGDSVGRMVKENPRVYAFYNAREAGVEEASGHFGMLSI